MTEEELEDLIVQTVCRRAEVGDDWGGYAIAYALFQCSAALNRIAEATAAVATMVGDLDPKVSE